MIETAHIFTPPDDSLEARINAYKSVYEAWFNAEAFWMMMNGAAVTGELYKAVITWASGGYKK